MSITEDLMRANVPDPEPKIDREMRIIVHMTIDPFYRNVMLPRTKSTWATMYRREADELVRKIKQLCDASEITIEAIATEPHYLNEEGL